MKNITYIILASVLLSPFWVNAATTVIRPTLGAVKVNSTLSTPARTGLLGAWAFDSGDMNSSNVLDKSGRRLTGTLNNFVTLTKVLGIGGQALIFDGVNDNVSFGDVAEAGNLTLAAWVKPAVVQPGMKIVSKKMAGSNSQYGLSTSADFEDKFYVSFYSSAASSDDCESTDVAGTYEANKWYFVVGTYDGEGCKIYVNGVDTTNVISDLASGDIINTTSALRIGADGGVTIAPGSYFNGAIDDVKIFSRAYTAEEVQALYIKSLGPVRIKATQVAR